MQKELENTTFNPIKILIITDTFPPEKVGSYRMHDLTKYLCRDGFDVTVISPPPTFPFGNFKRTWKLASIQFSNGFKLVNLWTWQPKSVSLSKLSRIAYYSIMPVLALFWSIFNTDFDVVITSSGSTPLVWLPGFFVKKMFKKGWIVDERDLLIEGAISLGFLRRDSLVTHILRSFEFMCYRTSDYITVTAENARRGVLSYGLLKNKVLLIPNGAETDIFYPIPISKKRQIIYAGNFGHAQDFDCLISAMDEIAKHKIKLLLVGEGEVKNKLQRKVSEMNLDNSVIFMNGVERHVLPPLLCESMVGLSSWRKLDTIDGAIPAKIFDYMACAIPFVAIGGTDLKHIATTTGAGFVIDNDPQVIAKTIIYLAENSEVRKKMGKKGREHCERYYNRRLVARRIESLIFKLHGTCG
jgi:colanic acid biosynthesis glycosyl transferase WcaI